MRREPPRCVFLLSAPADRRSRELLMTPREQEEYRALRATIRERGTARIGLCVIGFGVWAAVMIAAAALSPTPVSVLLPLLFLAVVFEAVLSLHVGVERIGRYIQVFYE